MSQLLREALDAALCFCELADAINKVIASGPVRAAFEPGGGEHPAAPEWLVSGMHWVDGVGYVLRLIAAAKEA